MATVKVCDLCRKEIKDEVMVFLLPSFVISEYEGRPEKRWWTQRDLELCKDCRMKVIDALKDIVDLEIHRR